MLFVDNKDSVFCVCVCVCVCVYVCVVGGGGRVSLGLGFVKFISCLFLEGRRGCK